MSKVELNQKANEICDTYFEALKSAKTQGEKEIAYRIYETAMLGLMAKA